MSAWPLTDTHCSSGHNESTVVGFFFRLCPHPRLKPQRYQVLFVMPALRWHCATAAYVAKDGRCLKFPLSSSSPHVFPCGTEEAEPPLRHWRRMSRASAPVSWCLCTHVTCISLAVMQAAFTRSTLEPRGYWAHLYKAVIYVLLVVLMPLFFFFFLTVTWMLTNYSYVINFFFKLNVQEC